MHLFQEIPHKHITGLANASMVKGINTTFVRLTSPTAAKNNKEEDILFVMDPAELSWQTAEKLKCKVYVIEKPVPKFAIDNPRFSSLSLDGLADHLRFSNSIDLGIPFFDRRVTYIHSDLDLEKWTPYLKERPEIICFGKYVESYGYVGAAESPEVIPLSKGATFVSLDGLLEPEMRYWGVTLTDPSNELIKGEKPATYSEVLEALLNG